MGAVSDESSPILNDKIRTFGINGVDNYMYHEDVEDHLQDLVVCYNSEENVDPVETAYKVLQKFLKIYQFEGGNRKLGRLLVSYHLCVSGILFPVSITSGKRCSRKHYYDVIKKENLLYSNCTNLCTLISHSAYLGLKNFLSLKKSIKMT